MKGFKDFIMRGNLVEIAVAFIMAAAFAVVVSSFTAMIMDIIGKFIGKPDFSSFKPGGVNVGAFITALVAFIIVAAVVYFFVVKPYTAAKERYFPTTPEEEQVDEQTELLKEIRDALKARS